MAYFRSVIGGACVGAGAVGAWQAYQFSSWLDCQVAPIPERQRGDWETRVKEVFLAKWEQLRVIDRRMHDETTRTRHVATVASLPAHSEMRATAKAESERYALLDGYGYLFQSIYGVTQSVHNPTFVFRYDQEASSKKPRLIFAGTLHELSNCAARRDILKGEYTLLPSVVPMRSFDNADVIITGTRTLGIDAVFKEKLLRDAARVAVGCVKRCFPDTSRCMTVNVDRNNPLLEQTPIRVVNEETANITLSQLIPRYGDHRLYSQYKGYRGQIEEGSFSVESGKGVIGGIVVKPT